MVILPPPPDVRRAGEYEIHGLRDRLSVPKIVLYHKHPKVDIVHRTKGEHCAFKQKNAALSLPVSTKRLLTQHYPLLRSGCSILTMPSMQTAKVVSLGSPWTLLFEFIELIYCSRSSQRSLTTIPGHDMLEYVRNHCEKKRQLEQHCALVYQ